MFALTAGFKKGKPFGNVAGCYLDVLLLLCSCGFELSHLLIILPVDFLKKQILKL